MSVEPAAIDTIVVDSVPLLRLVIDATASELYTYCPSLKPHTPFPSLFINLEGIQLDPHGAISIMSLYVPSRKRVYLIDVYRLGKETFSTTNTNGVSLKMILESSYIFKVLFDLRNASGALFSLYGISLDGIRDVQLMELGTRRGSKNFLASLEKCVKQDSNLSAVAKDEWEATNNNTRRLFDSALGGRCEIFNVRPLGPEIVNYCAGNVTLLPNLFELYNAKLHQPREKIWELHVLEATKERIKLSQSPNFDVNSESNDRGPWGREFIAKAINQWMERRHHGKHTPFRWR